MNKVLSSLIFIFLLGATLSAQTAIPLNGSLQTVNYTGSYVDYSIPASLADGTSGYDFITLTLNGGDGGRRRVDVLIYDCTAKGGEGATTIANLTFGTLNGDLEAGGTLRFIVGEAAPNITGSGIDGAGGGGGTGVLYLPPNLDAAIESNWAIIAVAGGGGGAKSDGVCWREDGKGGSASENGSNGYEAEINLSNILKGYGGEDGYGGWQGDGFLAGAGYGGGGALGGGRYFSSISEPDFTDDLCGQRGGTTGGAGGEDNNASYRRGGFGFGSGGIGVSGGGGGGGYSGGGGGHAYRGGGGGGSYLHPTYVGVAGSKSGGGTTSSPADGYITFQLSQSSFYTVYPECQDNTVTIGSDGFVFFSINDLIGTIYNTDGSVYNGNIISEVTGVESSAGFVQFNCQSTGVHTATVSVSPLVQGNFGRTTTCTANITVNSPITGSLTTSSNNVNCANAGTETITLTANFTGATEDISSFSWSGDGGQTATATVDVTPTEYTAYQVFIEDLNGCSALLTSEYIYIVDNNAPTLRVKNIEVALDDFGQVTVSGTDLDDGTFDDCSGFVMGLSQTQFTCDDLGENIVTVTAVDDSSNVASTTAIINVINTGSGCGAVLPLDLLSFTGQADDKWNKLYWTTANEEGFSHFEVERSISGAENWTAIATVSALSASGLGGDGAQVHGGVERSYDFTDEAPLGRAYYRLRNVDIDGRFSISDVIMLERENSGSLKVFPNPNKGQFTVELPTEVGARVQLTLLDFSGRIVLRAETTSSSYEQQASLPRGIYSLVAQTGERLWTHRIVIK